MDDFSAPPRDRLSRLTTEEGRSDHVSRRYSAFVKSLRYILPLLALVMTVIVISWDQGGRVKPMKKEELAAKSENIRNELLKPAFNSVDDNNQPYTVTADRATQNRENPDLVELDKPVATLAMNDGGKIEADAASGLYAQQNRKLNLEGKVHLKHSNGYTLSTEELRVDIAAQKAYSGRDIHIKGPAGTLDATGLEGDVATGSILFTGPAKVILFSDGTLLSPKEKTP